MRGPARPSNDGESYQTPPEVILNYHIAKLASVLIFKTVSSAGLHHLKAMYCCVQEFVFQSVIPVTHGGEARLCDGRRSP